MKTRSISRLASCCIIAGCLGQTLMAQSSDFFRQGETQVLSPSAYEMGKYGKVPVSYFNGLPNISVPLTEVRAKGYTLPVYLTYYAGGNRPDQHPGWVGQGWTLHAGGSITRIIKGFKDDMSKEEYLAFYEALKTAETAEVKDFEHNVFEGCMPIEEMAYRGEDTMRFGPLKPIGLRDPRNGKEAYAVVQLRQDNAAGTLYNLVGFQTHLKWPEQKRVFRMIPGLENAEFVRFGVMHKNTYLNSPRLLNADFRLRTNSRYYFAGQMTGVEGYVESAASGLMVGIQAACALQGLPAVDFPEVTAMGALAH